MKQELVYEEMDVDEIKPAKRGKSVAKEITITDLPGVGAATAEKLSSVGYDSLLSIAVASPGELVEVTGMSEAVARKIKDTNRTSARSKCVRKRSDSGNGVY